MRREKSAQFNFVWMFAIIVGGAILFLAIFGALRTGDTMRYESDTKVAKEISIMMNPLQAGFADGSYGTIGPAPQETKINNFCFSDGFGKNDISVSTRSNVGKPWNSAGGAISVHDKYVFSKRQTVGFDFYVFSKPFKFPYEISDLIFITSDNYCFLNTPEEIVSEITGMGIANIEVDNCTLPNATEVCFEGGGSSCDISVYGSCGAQCNSLYDEGTILKDGDVIKYVGNLMYAAIFADKEIYECNVERLMYRNSKIAEIFIQKASLMDARGCNTNLNADLAVWAGQTASAKSEDLDRLRLISNTMDIKNQGLCEMW